MDPRKKSRIQREQLALYEAVVRRRSDDPLHTFALNAGGQSKFVESVLGRKKRENWFIAANRAGKSDAGTYCGATLARYGDQSDDVRAVGGKGSNITIKDRATSGWVVSLDFPSSRDIVQPKYFDNGFLPPGATHEPFIPAHEILEWRVSDSILKLRNGSIIGFKSADSGRLKFQGAEKDWVHIDEECPKPIYEEIIIRVGQRPLNLFGTCTLLPPEGQVGGITWVFSDKVKPWQNNRAPEIGIFSASIYENPHIDRDEIRRLESIYPEGSTQRRIRLNGELIPGLAGARVYSGFSHALNVRKQPEIALRRPLCWVWDFNVEPMVSLIGQRERNLFRVFEELIIEESNLQEMCDYFKQKHPYHLAELWVYGDASGKDRSHQTKFTSYQIIMNCMKDYAAPLKIKVPESNPSITDRINSVNRVCSTEEGEVMLEVDPLCVELIADFEQVLSDGKQGIKKTYNKKDPYVRRTHTSDALGYWISQEAPVRPIGREQTRTRRPIPRPKYGRHQA